MGSLRLSRYLHSRCFESLRIGSTIFYTTTFVLGALKTPNIKLEKETLAAPVSKFILGSIPPVSIRQTPKCT
ncbi:hypothetical protein YC2023_114766 [Brassica napus]